MCLQTAPQAIAFPAHSPEQHLPSGSLSDSHGPPISVCKQTNSRYSSQVWSSLRLIRIIQGRVTLFWGMSESTGYNLFILHWHGEPNDPFADRVGQFTGRVGYLAFQPFHQLLASYILLWFVLSCSQAHPNKTGPRNFILADV